MTETERILEINQIKEKLSAYAFTESAKNKINELCPILSEAALEQALKETSESKMMIEKLGNPPFTAIDKMDEYLTIAGKGGCLTAEQLEQIAVSLGTISRLKTYLNKGKVFSVNLAFYEENLDALDIVRKEIEKAIYNGEVQDYASKELKNLRSDIQQLEEKIRDKADRILKSNKEYAADSFTVLRSGHICIPVRKEYKNKIPGSVIDKSATGSTLFIEPTSVAEYRSEIEQKRFEEEDEVKRILYTLSALVAEHNESFIRNIKTVEKLDFIIAKGKLSIEIHGIEPKMTMERKIIIKNGRHPLMDRASAVPLNFYLKDGIRGIVITGPNTGGKTVAIKTVGIHCFMAQCGLHIPCEDAEICMNNLILCDIGDGQNISENLSTFSAHITNILKILKCAGPQSLVILDELGSGTDPTEGMGIAIAVLEQIRKSGALFLVTTHYPEVKTYAEKTPEIMNARMSFDRESLRPKYQLEIGKSGESCALYIAGRLGMPKGMLTMAGLAAYKDDWDEIRYEDLLNTVPDKLLKEPAPSLKKKKLTSKLDNLPKFQRGDSVMILPDGKKGIVCKELDDLGMLGVQLPDRKINISHKRVKLLVASTYLYPDNYDFSIIFESVKNRKARHQMSRKYMPGLTIEADEDEGK
jgi:dsDNA-specific endonuclease/ATPase MutS2